MENNQNANQNKNKPPRSNQKGYYRNTRTKHTSTTKVSSNVKTLKAKRVVEETSDDIKMDIERIEKEIELEIREIQSAKLSF